MENTKSTLSTRNSFPACVTVQSTINDNLWVKTLLTSRRVLFILITDPSDSVYIRSPLARLVASYPGRPDIPSSDAIVFAQTLACVQMYPSQHVGSQAYLLANKSSPDQTSDSVDPNPENGTKNLASTTSSSPSSQAIVFTCTNFQRCLFSFANP